MARSTRKPLPPGRPLWLLTYCDMVTLLLAFFVLLLSMSTVDSSYLAGVGLGTGLRAMAGEAGGRIPPNVRQAMELVRRPWDAYEQPERLKDLLFPDQELPQGVDRKDFRENVNVLARNDGVALVLSDKLLFAAGGAALTPGGRSLLDSLSPFMLSLGAPVVVSGYADPGEQEPGTDPYGLSADRALAVLAHLVKGGMRPEQVAAGAYGPFKPVSAEASPQAQARNRRVELYLKTVPDVGGYMSR